MQEKREELARKLDAAAVAHECAGDLRSKADEAQEKSSRASHTFNGDRTEKNHQQMARAMEARDEATLEVERERRTYQAAMELALREISATPGRGLGELLEALQRRAHDLQYRFGEGPEGHLGTTGRGGRDPPVGRGDLQVGRRRTHRAPPRSHPDRGPRRVGHGAGAAGAREESPCRRKGTQ